MRFIRDKLIVDEENNMAAVSWRCEHNLPGQSGNSPRRVLLRALAFLMGRRPYWEGVDLFRFRDGKLAGKYTYTQSRLPLFRRGR